MAKGPRVTITGAGGFVGRNLRRRLARGDFDVVSISRTKIRPIGGERVIAGGYESCGVMRAVAGSDVLIHLVGAGVPSTDARYGEANAGMVRRAIALCRSAGIGRIVYLSGLGASPRSTEYFASKHAAEGLIRESGLDHVIFRPSYVVGGGDRLSRYLRGCVRRGTVPVPGSGRYRIQPIHIGDAVEVLARSAAGAGLANRTLDMVGPEPVEFGRYVRLFCRGTGARVVRTSLEEAYRRAVRGARGGMTADDLDILVGDFVGNHRALERASGIRLRPLAGILEACAPP